MEDLGKESFLGQIPLEVRENPGGKWGFESCIMELSVKVFEKYKLTQ